MPTARIRPLRPFAVVDLGSNTVRLVVFEGIARAPSVLFNERFFCGLGKGLGAEGLLQDDSVARAMASLDRFRRIAQSLGAERLHVLATAAVRNAANGHELVHRIERLTGARIDVLSGGEEARLAAAGVLSGIPEADGIVGDLGGGSLELVEVRGGRIGRAASLPIGPLSLAAFGRVGSPRVTREIARRLREVPWLERGRGGTLYAVGGSWRALALAHMALVEHPVHMVHGYTLSRADAAALAENLRGPKSRAIAKDADVAQRRIDLLPRAAVVLELLLARLRPAEVVFSATGLREGYLYDRLEPRERAKDPLLSAAATLSAREARNPAFGERLIPWTKRLFPREAASAERLRRAACLLSDLGWREHPDYRAEQVYLRVLRFPFLGIDHAERVRLASSVFAAAGGKLGKAAPSPALELLDPAERRCAQTVGAALRLAYVVSGGAVPVLADSTLAARGSRLTLALRRRALPVSPNVESAFERLVRAGGFAGGRIVTSP